MEGDFKTYFNAQRLHIRKRNTMAKKIMFNDRLSPAAKNQKIRDIVIPCKDGSPMSFERNGTQLLLKCGSGNPRLNKTIERGSHTTIPEQQRKLHLSTQSLKTRIVQLKLAKIHGLISSDDALVQFTALSTSLSEEEKQLQQLAILYQERTSMKTREQKAIELNRNLQAEVSALRDDLRNYQQTGETPFLKAATQRYSESITPLTNELRETKYQEAFTAKLGKETILVENQVNPKKLQVTL